MTRVYLDSKKVNVNIDLYARYSVLNLYVENGVLRRGSENVNLYGLFLSDFSANERQFHGNEVHFPILFTEREQAEDLFKNIKSHSDIKRFEESLEVLVSGEDK